MPVQVRLLGTPGVRLGKTWQPLPQDKRGALLAYLAYHGDWVTRDRLAFLFWPDTSETLARRNLRQLLNRTKALAAFELLEVEAQRLRWEAHSDVASFREALGRQAWQEALDHYQGSFCRQLSVPDAAGFDAWLELERDNLEQAWKEAVLSHARELAAQDRHPEAAARLKPLLERDDLAEDVLQHYLRHAYLAGQRDEALRAFHAFRARLETELGLEPLPETEALVRTIQGSEALEAAASRPAHARIPLAILRPPRLIGREATREAAAASDAAVVLLAGEAGIGKSRLLAGLAPEAPLLACREGLQAVPLHPVVPLVRDLLARSGAVPDLGHYLDDLARLVPEAAPGLLPGPADPLTAKGRLLEALARFLEGTRPGTGTPFRLAADDLQWADPGTLELLVFLGSRPGWRVFGAYRDHEAGPALRSALASLESARALVIFRLSPLPEEALVRLLGDLIGSDRGPAAFARWLHERTGGNPMFALEILKSLFERGALRSDERGWHSALDEITRDYGELEVPASVAGVIRRRVEVLSGPATRLLQAAAVVGQDFHPALLGRVAGLSEWAAVEALEEVEASGLVRGNAFHHDLARQTIYRGLPEARRRLLHRSVAEALEPREDPAATAEHWAAAGQTDEAVRAWLRQAAALHERGLDVDAVPVLERARAEAGGDARRADVLLALSRSHARLGNYRQQEQALAPVLASRPPEPLLAAAVCGQIHVLVKLGRLAEAAAFAERHRARLEASDDPDLRAEYALRRAEIAHLQGNWQEARALLEPAAAWARGRPPSPRTIQLLVSLAVVMGHLGEREEALPLLRETLEHARRAGLKPDQVYVSQNLLFSLIMLGRAKEGLEAAEEALALGRYAASDGLRLTLAGAYYDLGRYPDAQRHCRLVADETQEVLMRAGALGRLCAVYDKLGQPGRVQATLAQALTLLAEVDLPQARWAVLSVALQFGTSKQIEQAKPFLHALDPASLPQYLRPSVEKAQARHPLAGDAAESAS